MSLRLGVDVGGTNTDAVLLHGDSVIGSAKCCTSPDVLSGIQSAVKAALAGSNAGTVAGQLDTAAPDIPDVQPTSTDVSVACRRLCRRIRLHAGYHTLRQCLRAMPGAGSSCHIQTLRASNSSTASLL